ncbi:MAG: hypothetical protein ACNI27_14685 [Desulfovibrio sp.]
MSQSNRIESLTIASKNSTSTLPFWKSSFIEDTQNNRERWSGFCETLAPRTRLLRDPDNSEAGIPFRDGIWHGDLVFADDVFSLNIIEDIQEVRGDIVARGALTINKQFVHRVKVTGNLVIHRQMVRLPAPDISYAGRLDIFNLSSITQVKHFTPQSLISWGVKSDDTVQLKKVAYTFNQLNKIYTLTAMGGGNTFIFEDGEWIRAVSEEESRTQEAINKKLQRFCKLSGISAEMLIDSPRKCGYNIRKILRYLELLDQGLLDVLGRQKTPEIHHSISEIRTVLKDLDDSLAADNTDLANIRILIEMLEDDLCRSVGRADKLPREKLSEESIQQDLDYLKLLTDRNLCSEDLFLSTRRFIIFASSIFRSMTAQKALFKSIATLLTDYRTLVTSLNLTDAEKKRMRITLLLNNPERVLSFLREQSSSAEQEAAIHSVEQEVKNLSEGSAKDKAREIFNSPLMNHPDTAPEDKAILNALYTFQGVLADLNLTHRQFVDLLIANLQTPVGEILRKVKASLKKPKRTESKVETNPEVSVYRDSLIQSNTRGFILFLLRRLKWDLEVLRIFNDNTQSKLVEEKPKKSVAYTGVSPQLRNASLSRCNRIFILLGFGTELFSPLEDYTESNYLLLLDALKILSTSFEVTPETAAEAVHAQEIVTNFNKKIAGVIMAMRQEDEQKLARLLLALSDVEIEKLTRAFAVPHPKKSYDHYRKDMKVMKKLTSGSADYAMIFGPIEELLLFLNATLTSRGGRAAVAKILRPITKGLKDLQADIPINTFLKDPGLAMTSLLSVHDERDLKSIRTSLTKIKKISHYKLVKTIRDEKDCGDQDKEQLQRILEYSSGGVASMQFNEKSTCILMLQHFSSQTAEKVREDYGKGRYNGLTTVRIFRMLTKKLEREVNVLSLYNKTRI